MGARRPLILAAVVCATGWNASADDGEKLDNPLSEVCTISVSHDCEILALPSPIYPKITEAGDADCVVTYRVNVDGTVEVTDSVCSDERFVESAVQGMSSVRYETKDVCGRPCPTGQTVEYPLLYRFAE